MAFIELRGLCKSFGNHQAVKELTLEVEQGEFVSFLGGSGCGKTTTLRMIAGFELPDSGTIRLGGLDMTHVPPRKRSLGMVFQHYALFPNMNVRENVAFGLKIGRKSRAHIDAKVDEMLALIDMRDFDQRYPHQLSGGQQQRVALARALAIEPEALLLDEPLSALDAKIRRRLREDIRAIQRRLGITTIYVTHDQEEALSISDRVAVMRDGCIEQIGSPAAIYERPTTPFVAAFIGTLNALPVEAVDPSAGTLLLGGRVLRAGTAFSESLGRELVLGLRPESIELGPPRPKGAPDSPGRNEIDGVVEDAMFLGSIVRLSVSAEGRRVLVDAFNDPRRRPPAPGAAVSLSFPPEACFVTAAHEVKKVVVAEEE
jgi:putative spermidine/putrescine transport system ATP-binding protein